MFNDSTIILKVIIIDNSIVVELKKIGHCNINTGTALLKNTLFHYSTIENHCKLIKFYVTVANHFYE